jgi:hypothetical protein
MMGKIYSNFCNRSPVRGLFGREPIQSIRVGSDAYIVAQGKNPETREAGIQLTIKHNAYGNGNNTPQTRYWFSFDDMHEMQVELPSLVKM